MANSRQPVRPVFHGLAPGGRVRSRDSSQLLVAEGSDDGVVGEVVADELDGGVGGQDLAGGGGVAQAGAAVEGPDPPFAFHLLGFARVDADAHPKTADVPRVDGGQAGLHSQGGSHRRVGLANTA